MELDFQWLAIDELFEFDGVKESEEEHVFELEAEGRLLEQTVTGDFLEAEETIYNWGTCI